MLHQTLPPVLQAVPDAQAWIRTVVQSQHPEIDVTVAVDVIGELVASAVQHTPQDGLVEVRVKLSASGGVIVEVEDPAGPATGPHRGGHPGDWATMSRAVRYFGTSTAEGVHTAWCELPVAS